MADLPTGTVTFLFTDVEGSTRLWEQHSVAMREATMRHDALVEGIVEDNGGVLVRPRGEGDSRFAVFARASDAVAAATALQVALHAEIWPTPQPLRVRMALHTGEADLRDGDYYGTAVNRCARLRSIAHGGQVLVSQATYDLVRDALPSETGLRDLGEQRLTGLARPERVFQIVHPALPDGFPPFVAPDSRPGNLPFQLTSFVGREREMAEVMRLLGTTRLLTLTGTGGAGKTRLALQAAAECRRDAYPDGVWLVELDALTDPGLVAGSVAAAIGLREEPGQSMQMTLVGFCRSRRLLLVLDNCEHLIDACARLADALLRACPNVQILATSREGLGIAGEVNWRVPSLALPTSTTRGDAETPGAADELGKAAAVRLFVERARAALPEFELNEQNAPVVAQVCVRLDGMPLAIELAAARVKGLGIEQLAARLDQRFRILTGGSRTALPRHQTLRAAVDWSYELLDEPERRLFHRLSVFAAGFSLVAAEAVGGDGVLDPLMRLVDKSLVVAEPGHEGIERYHILETLRYYARERLAASGEAETIYRRHAEYYLTLAEQAARALRGPEQGRWLERLEEEHDNLRVALEWWTSTGDAKRGLRLGAALELFWFMRGHCGEGLARLLELLTLPSAANDVDGSPEWAQVRANALYGAGYLAYTLGDLEQARALREEGLAIGRRIGDKRIVAYALRGLAASAAAAADYAQARAQYEESLALFRALDDRWGIAYVLYRLGLVTFAQGDFARARPLFEESLAIARQDGDTAGIARCLNRLGLVAYLEGDYAMARTRFEDGLAIGEALGFAYAIGVSLRGLARVALDAGDAVAARVRFRASLSIHQNLGVPAEVASSLEGLAGVAASLGQPERALRLAGAADAKRRDLGRPLEPALQVVLDRWLERARRDLSEETAEAAWAEGQNMAIELAITQAMGKEAD